MDSGEDVINVVYTVNVQGEGASMFVNQLLASVASIAKHGAGERDRIHVYLLHGQLDENTIKTAVGLGNDRVKITSATFSR